MQLSEMTGACADGSLSTPQCFAFRVQVSSLVGTQQYPSQRVVQTDDPSQGVMNDVSTTRSPPRVAHIRDNQCTAPTSGTSLGGSGVIPTLQ